MILILEILLGIWYIDNLSSFMLCKQLIHMYDVDLGSTWIWKYMESCFEQWFIKDITFHN
jgi:hypothetical protein